MFVRYNVSSRSHSELVCRCFKTIWVISLCCLCCLVWGCTNFFQVNNYLIICSHGRESRQWMWLLLHLIIDSRVLVSLAYPAVPVKLLQRGAESTSGQRPKEISQLPKHPSQQTLVSRIVDWWLTGMMFLSLVFLIVYLFWPCCIIRSLFWIIFHV